MVPGARLQLPNEPAALVHAFIAPSHREKERSAFRLALLHAIVRFTETPLYLRRL